MRKKIPTTIIKEAGRGREERGGRESTKPKLQMCYKWNIPEIKTV